MSSSKFSKTELLNRAAQSPEERLLLSRVLDKAEFCDRKNLPADTPFLSPGERVSVEALIHSLGNPAHVFLGGWDGAERTVCRFLPDWMDEEAGREDPPFCVLRCTHPAMFSLTHRDYLGALMGLGITREKIGDLLVSELSCDIIVQTDLREFILQELVSAGRSSLSVQEIPLNELRIPVQQVKEVRDTVSSVRLDAVVSSGFSMARGKATEAVESGAVQLNHRVCLKGSQPVQEGDSISCRGLGKLRVKEVGGLSKKGRTILVLERYL